MVGIRSTRCEFEETTELVGVGVFIGTNGLYKLHGPDFYEDTLNHTVLLFRLFSAFRASESYFQVFKDRVATRIFLTINART